MIHYDAGYWGIGLIWQLRGSVLPKALCWAIPSALITALLHALLFDSYFPLMHSSTGQGINMGVSGYTMVLGFLLTFRTREAHSRWWESVTLLQTSRGEWFGAYSNLLAFCSHDSAKAKAVDSFQNLLVRLMSLLYGSALDEVTTVDGTRFEIFDLRGFDSDHLDHFACSDGKLDLVLQWIQQLVVIKHREGVLDIAPPILSRVFQELSRGKVNITNARKLKEFPFPFPYAQLLSQALMMYWLMTPFIMCVVCDNSWWASFMTFTTNLFLWSINYVGEEIEEPFGSDANDLPLPAMQKSFNRSLVSLLKQHAQTPPDFYVDESNRNLKPGTFGDPASLLAMRISSSQEQKKKRPRGFSSSSIFSDLELEVILSEPRSMYTPTGPDGGIFRITEHLNEDETESRNEAEASDEANRDRALSQEDRTDDVQYFSAVGGDFQDIDPGSGDPQLMLPPRKCGLRLEPLCPEKWS